MQRKVSVLWGEKKVVLRQTPRAVTPFGGLSALIEFLKRIGFPERMRQDQPFGLSSPNALLNDLRIGYVRTMSSTQAQVPFNWSDVGVAEGQMNNNNGLPSLISGLPQHCFWISTRIRAKQLRIQ